MLISLVEHKIPCLHLLACLSLNTQITKSCVVLWKLLFWVSLQTVKHFFFFLGYLVLKALTGKILLIFQVSTQALPPLRNQPQSSKQIQLCFFLFISYVFSIAVIQILLLLFCLYMSVSIRPWTSWGQEPYLIFISPSLDIGPNTY